jgi:hypothetical protein
MDICWKSPRDCSEEELDEFHSLIQKGDEVSPRGLLERMKRAKALVFARDEGLVGVGAIKQPADGYRKRVFEKAGVCDRAASYPLEFGWLYVCETGRCLGTGEQIVRAAMGIVGDSGCFATARKDNCAMYRLFQKVSFSRLGEEYESDDGERILVLYEYKPQQNASLDC